jgi:hypothetical protein
MYHPDLHTAPGYNPIEVPDDDGLVATMTESGWGVVEPPEQTDPAKAAVQPDATYVVKNPDETGKTRRVAKKTD